VANALFDLLEGDERPWTTAFADIGDLLLVFDVSVVVGLSQSGTMFVSSRGTNSHSTTS
jgi:hypothetical protein